ncbi:hypothetical protein [Streptomyces sp. NPDC051219]|uniref:hypothetical protein n=1 Tax=Streptomyces sp. NPDC051219 TaxID=3155283 RepID=UPI003416455E
MKRKIVLGAFIALFAVLTIMAVTWQAFYDNGGAAVAISAGAGSYLVHRWCRSHDRTVTEDDGIHGGPPSEPSDLLDHDVAIGS